MPFNSRVRFHNSDPEGSVRSVWEESVRGELSTWCECSTRMRARIYVNIIAEATDHERGR